MVSVEKNMACEIKKSLSLFVGWFNIVLSFSIPIGLIFLFEYGSDRDLTSIIHDEDVQLYMICCACGVVPWLIASILLVKGITENRPKLMAPWIYLSYVLIMFGGPVMVYVLFYMSKYSRTWDVGIYYSLRIAIGLVYLLLCLIPVRNFYNELSNPPQIQPTQCNLKAKQTENHQRYMPVFDN